MKRFERIVNSLSKWLNWIAGIGLVLMLLVIVIDIIGAKLFRSPLPGGVDTVSLLGVVVIAFAIAQTQIVHGHIEVEFFVMRIPEKARNIIAGIIYSLGILLFVLLSWQSFDFGYKLQLSGEVSMTMGIPLYPFVYGITFSCIVVVLVLLLQYLKEVLKVVK